jgi:hypothetical protein
MESGFRISTFAMRFLLGALCAICFVGFAGAQCPDKGTLGFDGVTAVREKPFHAKQVTTIVTYRPDGTKQIVVIKSNLFRDSHGRVRVERFYDGTGDPPELTPADISIYDGCGKSISLLPKKHTAKVQDISPVNPGSHQPYCHEFDAKNPPNPGPTGKFEDLGHKMIDGMEVLGYRSTDYATPESKRTETNPVHIHEDWCSMALDNSLHFYSYSDRPRRELTSAIKEIELVDSDGSLFEIPSEYSITKTETARTAISTSPK